MMISGIHLFYIPMNFVQVLRVKKHRAILAYLNAYISRKQKRLTRYQPLFLTLSGCLAFLFLPLSPISVQAQTRLTDHLKQQLSAASQDTSRVLLLSELCLQYRLSRPDSAMLYGQKALALAREINFSKGEVNTLGSIGFVMREVGNLPNALTIELKAYQMAESNGFISEMARCMNIIGNIYFDLKDYPKALTYYQQARQKHILSRNEIGLSIAQSNIGSTYEQMNRLDSAWAYERQAYQKMLRLKLVNNKPYVLRIMGNIQAKSGNTRLAMHYYQQSRQAAIQENSLRNVAFVNTEIARLYKKQNKLDSCIYYALQGLTEGQKGSYKREILRASSLLADVYEASDPHKALYYHKLAAATKDSLYGDQTLQSIQAIAFGEQERKRDMEAAQIAYTNRIRQYSLLIGLAVLLIIALILWRINLQKQKANALLSLQKIRIGQQAHQLTLMMQELHHRVKNNFAIVSSLLKLQSSRLEDEKAVQAIRSGQQRVEAMSLIHQRLYQGDRVTTVNMEEYLTDLATGLRQAYGYTPGNFDLQIRVEQQTVDVDIAMPLGLIANELITNAFKYAYMDNPCPMLRISLFNENGLTLEIQDNGPGINEEEWKQRSGRASFGRQLIVSLSDQLEGTFELIKKNGTLFRLYIPDASVSNLRSAAAHPVSSF